MEVLRKSNMAALVIKSVRLASFLRMSLQYITGVYFWHSRATRIPIFHMICISYITSSYCSSTVYPLKPFCSHVYMTIAAVTTTRSTYQFRVHVAASISKRADALVPPRLQRWRALPKHVQQVRRRFCSPLHAAGPSTKIDRVFRRLRMSRSSSEHVCRQWDRAGGDPWVRSERSVS